MNEGLARSAGLRRCIIALTAVFCALTVGPGCGRETFNLLDVAGNAGSSSSPISAGAAGSLDSFGGGGNGNETGGGAGKTGMSHGGAGGGAGFGQGGAGGNPNRCLAGETCGSAVCPPSVSFCERCDSSNDCLGDKDDSPYCIASVGRCVQCRDPGKVAIDCALDEMRYPLTLRCAHHCQSSDQCVDDENHPICDRQFGACVACTRDADCHVNGHAGYCALGGTCVECDQSNEDAPSAAAAQCPDDEPYCVGLRCQNKPH